MATKRHQAFWEYLNGMAEENSNFSSTEEQDAIPKCKHCNSTSVIRYGHYSGIQRWWCKECKRKFVNNKASPGMKTPRNQIAFTLNMYFEGKTLNIIRQNLQRIYNSYPSDSTLYGWIGRFTKKAIAAEKKLKPIVGDVWVAVETPLIIGEREAWFWDIIDIHTGFIMAYTLCTKRTKSAAEALVMKAVNKVAKLPRVVVSDKLTYYINDIELNFGTQKRRITTKTINTTSGTQLLDKLHSALKARTAIVGRFKNIRSAGTIIQGWPVYHNYIREYEITFGNTPAYRAGLKQPLKIKIR